MIEAADLGLLYFFGGRQPDWLTQLAVAVTTLGNPGVLTGVGVAGTLLLLARRQPRLAILFAAVSVASWGLERGGKAFVGRPRPDVRWRVVALPNQPSFPSGHALCSTAIYGSLGLILAQLPRQRRGPLLGSAGAALAALVLLLSPRLVTFDLGGWERFYWTHFLLDACGGAAVALIAAGLASLAMPRWAALVGGAGLAMGVPIGLTRPYLGVHYPFDVVAGWLGGLVCALVAHGVTTHVLNRPGPKPPGAALRG